MNKKTVFAALSTLSVGAVVGVGLALSPVNANADQHEGETPTAEGEKACSGDKKCSGDHAGDHQEGETDEGHDHHDH